MFIQSLRVRTTGGLVQVMDEGDDSLMLNHFGENGLELNYTTTECYNLRLV